MLRKSSQLNIKSKRRNGERISGGGTFKSERNYIDFVIDGISLSEIVRSAGHDLISVFKKEWVPEEREKSYGGYFCRNRLTSLTIADRLWFAPSAAIWVAGHYPYWSSLRKKNSFGVTSVAKKLTKKNFTSMDFLDLGPFHFESRAYKEILADAMLQLTQ
jgi:hypothetical protein